MKKSYLALAFFIFCIALYAQNFASSENDSLLDSTQTEQFYIDFMNEYNKSIFKSLSKLTIMHRRNPLAKLGKEEISGDYSGTLSYDASVKGFGGDVIMIYTDYCDFNNWVINGESNVFSAMDLNGYMYGKTEIRDSEGKLIATIDYTKVELKKGVVGGGVYGITLAGKDTYWLPWNKIIQCPYK